MGAMRVIHVTYCSWNVGKCHVLYRSLLHLGVQHLRVAGHDTLNGGLELRVQIEQLGVGGEQQSLGRRAHTCEVLVQSAELLWAGGGGN